jgi:hypothetical protein
LRSEIGNRAVLHNWIGQARLARDRRFVLPCQPEEVVARFSIDRVCVVLPSGGRGGATLRKSRRRSGSDRFRKCTAPDTVSSRANFATAARGSRRSQEQLRRDGLGDGRSGTVMVTGLPVRGSNRVMVIRALAELELAPELTRSVPRGGAVRCHRNGSPSSLDRPTRLRKLNGTAPWQLGCAGMLRSGARLFRSVDCYGLTGI